MNAVHPAHIKRLVHPTNENSVINYLLFTHTRYSFFFRTQIKLFFIKSESFLTLHRQQRCMAQKRSNVLSEVPSAILFGNEILKTSIFPHIYQWISQHQWTLVMWRDLVAQYPCKTFSSVYIRAAPLIVKKITILLQTPTQSFSRLKTIQLCLFRHICECQWIMIIMLPIWTLSFTDRGGDKTRAAHAPLMWCTH